MPATLNETELMSIIGNLLDNAVDATLKAPVPAPVELYISDRNQELLIEVADRGCGVEDAMKPHIFRQGFSSKPDSENDIVGTEHGIGLFWWQDISTRLAAALRLPTTRRRDYFFCVYSEWAKHDPST
jgi:two-component system cit operon sensor histidine kinase CitA